MVIVFKTLKISTENCAIAIDFILYTILLGECSWASSLLSCFFEAISIKQFAQDCYMMPIDVSSTPMNFRFRFRLLDYSAFLKLNLETYIKFIAHTAVLHIIY